MTAPETVTPDDVRRAGDAIRGHVRVTPVLSTPAADFGLSGAPLTFKLEFMQHSGSFKARGAFANLLLREETRRGVVAASGGNHGAAVAYAARQLGVPAHIFVPQIASPAKIERIKSYGAEIVVGGEFFPAAHAASQVFARERGLPELHPYDALWTLGGQGTVAEEWRRQSPELDTLLVAVGGGGLIGGMAAYLQGQVRLIGVEPENAPTLERALAAGRQVDVSVSGVAADSLGAGRIGALALPLAQQFVERVVLVEDKAISAAQQTIWDVLRLVVEPGGAAALAALLSGRYVPAPEERVGVLLCGANTSAVKFG